MAENGDPVRLGLSLSLDFPYKSAPPSVTAPFPMNLFRSDLSLARNLDSSNGEAFRTSSDGGDTENRSVFRGIDMNRAAKVSEEVALASSPNSTVSSLSGKRSEREENDGERASGSFDLDDDGGDAAAARKKLRLSKEQAAVLEETFKEHNTLNSKQKKELAVHLKLKLRQVEVWFQNRRARTKLKQTEVDCEYLRRCCENLTEENRRLQKEVAELRALKLSPQFYMNTGPPTTLTMCPQCQRVNSSSTSTLPATSTSTGFHGVHHHQKSIFPSDAHRPRS